MIRENATKPEDGIPAFKNFGREKYSRSESANIPPNMSQHMQLEFIDDAAWIVHCPEIENICYTNLKVGLSKRCKIHSFIH